MNRYDLKKVLAGLSIVTLMTGAGLTFAGCATTDGGAKADCKCKEHKEGVKTSCSGTSSCSCVQKK